MSTRVLVLAAAAALAGCSSDISAPSARDSCYDVWAAVCERYYQCYTADQIAEIGLPATAAQCGSQLGGTNCAGWGDDTCSGDRVFHPPVVPECETAILALDCAVISDAPDSAPICDGVCDPQ